MCSDGLPGGQSLGEVASEATDIGSEHGDLVETRHVHDLRDVEAVLEPFGEIVWCYGQYLWLRTCTMILYTSKPMRNIFARAGKCAPGDDKSTIIGTSRTHGVMGVNAHHGSVKVVGIMFRPTTPELG
jgi:hypothetical protein